MIARLLPALLAVALLAPSLPAAAAELPPGGTFLDDDGNTHESYIEALFAAGITKGCNPPASDRYCPRNVVTRGELAAFLRRSLGLPAASEDHFNDDASSIFEGDINALATAGATRGCNPPANDRFCPDNPITREQLAAFFTRAVGYPATDQDFFNDDDGSPFEPEINALAAAGVTKGCGAGAFCPDAFLTRDEMASFLGRALGLQPIAVEPRPVPSYVNLPAISNGSSGSNVEILQQALRDKGFYRSSIDGRYGDKTAQAVMAFHKALGVSRSFNWQASDGRRLFEWTGPRLRYSAPERVEVDISSQVAYIVKGGSLRAILPVSSGNGELFYSSNGNLVRAHTPRGNFTIQRHINGLRVSYLGELWRPWYFTGGYAMHGSSSVPSYPASHGCIRVPMWDSDWLEGQLFVGMPFHVYD